MIQNYESSYKMDHYGWPCVSVMCNEHVCVCVCAVYNLILSLAIKVFRVVAMSN